ncbi:MAG: hypothetical protein HYY23_02490 [Verrucomicrobia bacterium]|nr:hypothetical protein [Verrucomicrobiota bacterium]
MKEPTDHFSFDSCEFDNDLEEIESAKSKLIMDFGLEQPKPERVTLEVLKQLIREKPDKMSQAIRRWLRPDDTR